MREEKNMEKEKRERERERERERDNKICIFVCWVFPIMTPKYIPIEAKFHISTTTKKLSKLDLFIPIKFSSFY